MTKIELHHAQLLFKNYVRHLKSRFLNLLYYKWNRPRNSHTQFIIFYSLVDFIFYIPFCYYACQNKIKRKLRLTIQYDTKNSEISSQFREYIARAFNTWLRTNLCLPYRNFLFIFYSHSYTFGYIKALSFCKYLQKLFDKSENSKLYKNSQTLVNAKTFSVESYWKCL